MARPAGDLDVAVPLRVAVWPDRGSGTPTRTLVHGTCNCPRNRGNVGGDPDPNGGPMFRPLIVAAAVTLVACGASDEIRNDDPPPSTVSNECGESGACEGSATTEPAGCDVPGVAVFDLEGQPLCSSRWHP